MGQPAIWLNMQGPGANDGNRFIGQQYLERGFDALADRIAEFADLGYRRCILQNPYGFHRGEDMQFDQKLEMADENNDGRYNELLKPGGYTKSISKMTRQGIEVIHKLGALRKDPDFQPGNVHRRDNKFRRIYECIAEPLHVGAQLAWDAAGDQGEDTLTAGLLTTLAALGVKNYIEPWPTVPNLQGYTGFAMDRWFQWSTTPGMGEGVNAPAERMVIMTGRHPYKITPEQLRDRCNLLIDFGLTPIVASDKLKFDGEHLQLR